MGKSNRKYDYVPARLVEGASRWYIVFYVWDLRQQKLVRKRIGVGKVNDKKAKRRECQMKIAEINAMLAEGYVIGGDEPLATPEEKQAEPTLFLDALEVAVKAKSAANGEFSQSNYHSCFQIFSDWLKREGLAGLALEQIEKKHIYAFLDYLYQEREVSNRTVSNYIIRLKALFNVLIEREMLTENPAKGIKKPQAASESHTVYTEQQRILLEQHLREHYPRLFLFTRFIYFAFLRPVEITRLKAAYIKLDRRIIVMPAETVKSRRQQSIFIVDPLYQLLKEARVDELPGDYYLFSKNLEPGPTQWHRKNATYLHRQALEEVDLYDGKLTMYSWKHTGVCNAYLANVDIKTLQSLLRHSSLDMTAIYMRALGLRVEDNLKGVSW